MLTQISVYITIEQAQKLEKEGNKSKAVRDALDSYWEENSKLNSELSKIYRIVAREYLKWNIIQKRPTPHEASVGGDEKAAVILSELYDITSDIVGHNINSVKALEFLEDATVNPLDIYKPSPQDLAARKISEEEYVKISKDLIK